MSRQNVILLGIGSHYFVVAYGKGWSYYDSVEHLVVYVAVEMFH